MAAKAKLPITFLMKRMQKMYKVLGICCVSDNTHVVSGCRNCWCVATHRQLGLAQTGYSVIQYILGDRCWHICHYTSSLDSMWSPMVEPSPAEIPPPKLRHSSLARDQRPHSLRWEFLAWRWGEISEKFKYCLYKQKAQVGFDRRDSCAPSCEGGCFRGQGLRMKLPEA